MKNYTMHTFAHFVQHCLKMYISWILSAFSKHEKFILLHIPCGVLLIKTKLMKSKKAFVLFSLYWKLLSLYSKTVCFTCDGLQIYLEILQYCFDWALQYRYLLTFVNGKITHRDMCYKNRCQGNNETRSMHFTRNWLIGRLIWLYMRVWPTDEYQVGCNLCQQQRNNGIMS